MLLITIFISILLILGLLYSILEPSSDWKKDMEKRMLQEGQKYEQLSNEELIEELKNHKWGSYAIIWDVIKNRANPKFLPHLIQALPYLDKEEHEDNHYYCAHAIFIIA